jgi:hypothetical protein
MTTIESERTHIATTDETLFNFLSDFNNVGKLMPSSVTDWQSDTEGGCFTIKNMATIGLKIEERVANRMIKMEKTKAPFDLSLYCHIAYVSDVESILQISLDADLNPMLKMMAETPLRNFVNILATNCQKYFTQA